MGSADQHPHVALLAFPFGTHAAPLLSLARALASSPSAAGASFSLLTTARSAASLSSAASTSNLIRVIEIADGAPAGYVPPADRPEEEVGLFMRETPGNFREGIEKAVEAAGGVRVTCVVSDAFLWFAGEIARGLGAPWVALWTGGPCSLSAHLHTDLLRREIGIEGDALSLKLDKDLDFIPGLSGLRARDLPEGIVTGDITGKFATLLHKMGLELPSATAVALNSFQGINPDLESDFAAKFKKSLHVGPLNLLNPSPVQPDRSDCIQWLDGRKPASVAYISFGTVMCLPPSELAELAAGVEASGVQFLWSMKDFVREQLPAGFLDRTVDRGIVVPWAPQVDVLAHEAVGAFVTHCGWNSVLESITGGVPMLCRPFLGDQMLNARAVAHVWRVGVRFEGEGIERGAAARALRRVLEEEEGEGMRERIGGLKETAAKAVGPGGSSVQNFKSLLGVILMKH